MSSQGLGITIGGLIGGFALFFTLFRVVKSLKRYRIKGLIYILLMAILLSLPGFLYFLKSQVNETLIFVFAQIIWLGVGVVNIFFLKKIFPSFFTQPFVIPVLFNLCIILFTILLLNIIAEYLISPTIRYSQFFGLLWFLVPLVLAQTIRAVQEVPAKIYNAWYYPLHQETQDPSDEELKNPLVISFVFNKNRQTNEYTTFRARAPLNMPVGRLFYFFLNDYNERNPESEINFLDHENIPTGWVFFKDRKGFFSSRKVIDTEVSIKGNDIKENDILLCKRMPIQKLTVNAKLES